MATNKNRQKFKHNKKRNTAFLFEVLVKELTKASVNKNPERRRLVSSILKEHFSKGTVLYKELDAYRILNETSGIDRTTAERVLSEAKRTYAVVPQHSVFAAQSELIDDINKNVGEDVYGNFVPHYKSLATISQIFNQSTSMKDRVILENQIVRRMMADPSETSGMKPITNLAYKTFIEKFNKEYGGRLHEEQKNLLSKFILSFVDNGLDLKVYLNEEIGRLKQEVKISKNCEEIKADPNMQASVDKVSTLLESFSTTKLDESGIKKILKIQEFVREVRG